MPLIRRRVRPRTDEAIAEVANVQRRIGLSAISDGQYRRPTWASVLYEGVEGFGGTDGPVSSPLSDLLGQAGTLPGSPPVVAKLEATGRLAAAEAGYLPGGDPAVGRGGSARSRFRRRAVVRPDPDPGGVFLHPTW